MSLDETIAEAHKAIRDISEYHEFVGVAQLARHMKISRQRIQKFVNEEDFPEPVIELYAPSGRPLTRLWLLTEVHEWRRKRGDKRTYG